jgi:hypothetical protein
MFFFSDCIAQNNQLPAPRQSIAQQFTQLKNSQDTPVRRAGASVFVRLYCITSTKVQILTHLLAEKRQTPLAATLQQERRLTAAGASVFVLLY